MDKREKKRIMTDLAKGKITQKEVDLLINPKKDENSSVKTRKNSIQTTKQKGGKKNSK